jgi:hypothetical protein
VHAHPERIKTEAAKTTFQQGVKKWIQDHVSRHKFLRGGGLSISWPLEQLADLAFRCHRCGGY